MSPSTRRSRPLVRSAGCALLALLLLATACAADALAQPATRPAGAGAGSGGGGGGGGGGGAMHRPGMRGGRFDRLSAEEVAEAIEFTRKVMPNLARSIDEAGPGSPRARMRLVHFAVERWRSVQRVLREDPDQYDAAVERLRSHDQVFALVRRLNEAPEEQRPALQEQIRERMREIMQDLLTEREQRIENLQRMLSREQELLDRDRERIDELTAQRAEALQREFREMGGTTSAGDLTPPDLSTAPGAPVEPNLRATAPSTAPSGDRPRRAPK